MNRLLTDIEFFTFEDEVWYRLDGSMCPLKPSDTSIVELLLDHIRTFYPDAHKALCEEYAGCAQNKSYFRYRMVCRFIRCNFAPLDNIPDITCQSKLSFEFVPCPMRGECRRMGVICRPDFDHQLSAAELPVMRLWHDGLSVDDISTKLCLSPHTVHNHIRNAYQRLGIHSKSEFVKFASQNSLFK